MRRQEQVSKKSNEKSEKVQKERLLTTLPLLGDQLESYSIVKRKTTFLMQDLVKNLTRAPIKGAALPSIQVIVLGDGRIVRLTCGAAMLLQEKWKSRFICWSRWCHSG